VVGDRDETETFDFQSETRPRPSKFFTRPRRLELRLKTETIFLLYATLIWIEIMINVRRNILQWCGAEILVKSHSYSIL
jgi:hypothetical protein